MNALLIALLLTAEPIHPGVTATATVTMQTSTLSTVRAGPCTVPSL